MLWPGSVVWRPVPVRSKRIEFWVLSSFQLFHFVFGEVPSSMLFSSCHFRSKWNHTRINTYRTRVVVDVFLLFFGAPVSIFLRINEVYGKRREKNAHTLRIWFLQIFWSNRQINFIENSDSIVCRSMNVYSLMLFSFCSNKICAFNILSSVDHLNSVFPLIRIYLYRMQSNRFVMSEAATNSPREYANEFNWNSRMNRVRLSLKSTDRFSWRNPPFDHIQGDQSGSPGIPAPPSCFV